jgi:uncharacterized membrane protein
VKIVSKLDEWNKAGLLDETQVAKIARYEEERSPHAQWVVWGIGAVGALAIVVGVVSVISANWEGIPTWVKLLSSIALMLGTLAGAWSTSKLASLWPRDLFLFLHAGLTLATVGLVAQVYHLHGHAWRAPALCAVLALPAAVIATRSLLTYVVLGHVTVASCLLLDEVGWLEGEGLAMRFFVAAFGLSLVVVARILASRREGPASALRGWGFVALAGVATHACAAWGQSSRWTSLHESEVAVLLSLGLFALSVGFAVGIELVTPATGRTNRLLALGLFVGLLGGGALISGSLTAVTSEPLARQLLGFAIACALCIAVAIAAAHAGSKRGTNLATGALALRILFIYLELAKDLMTTGAGLIATGFVFLGLAYGWWRLRRVLPVAARLEAGAA